MKIQVYNGDISYKDVLDIRKNSYIGIDTETTGLDPLKEELCLIQISSQDNIFIVKYNKDILSSNIIEVLKDKNVCKVFHHATFDIRFLMQHLKIKDINNVVCTKIAFKLLNGLNENSSLKNLIKFYFNINLDKSEQLSDWSQQELSKQQLDYAANDVKYLIPLWLKLKKDLECNNLIKYAEQCWTFLPTQAYLQNRGIENIFKY